MLFLNMMRGIHDVKRAADLEFVWSRLCSRAGSSGKESDVRVMRQDERAIQASGLAGVNLDLMRRQNLASVLSAIGRRGEVSRTNLVAETGLTRAGVASLLKELHLLGLVEERGVRSGDRAGRPSSHARFTDASYVTISVEISVGTVTTVSRDLQRSQLSEDTRAVDKPSDAKAVLGLAKTMLHRTMRASHGLGRHLLGVAIIAPAIISPDRRRILSSPALGWADIDVVSEMELDKNVVIVVDNYANFAAIAESVSAPAVHLVHVQAGEGIGAGTAFGGIVQRGGGGFAGAVGHISMDPSGPPCTCGRRGCLEALANFDALLRRAAPDLAQGRRSAMDLLGEVAQRARTGDARAIDGIVETGRWLGRGIGSLINIVSPSIVKIGGYVPVLEPWVLSPVIEEARRGVVVPDLGGCVISASSPGAEAIELGATLSVQREAFSAEGLRNLRRSHGLSNSVT